MKTKFKIQYILAFLLTVIVFNLSNSYALTNKDVLKVSEISDTKFLCLYYVNGTKLAQTRNDGSLVFYDINNILSWAYQYSNKIIDGNIYSQTQFFTEKYMIDYLVGNVVDYDRTKKIVDPCAGGGNFLVECLDYLCDCLGEKINVDKIEIACIY